MQIRWTNPAVQDLTRIGDYTREHFGTDQAQNTAMLIYAAADSLLQFPRRGRVGRRPDTREIAIPGLPFLVIYRIEEESIQILRVLHGAQQWP